MKTETSTLEMVKYAMQFSKQPPLFIPMSSGWGVY